VEKPCYHLERSDGNALALVQVVCRALIDAGQAAAAVEFAQRALQGRWYAQIVRRAECGRSYEEVLELALQYVDDL